MTPSAPASLVAAVAAWAERTPGAPALFALGCRDLTYAELVRQAFDLRASLKACGADGRKRVALVLPDGPLFSAALFAALVSNDVAPLSRRLLPADIVRLVTEMDAAAIVALREDAELYRSIGRPVIELETLAGVAGGFAVHGASGRPALETLEPPLPDDPALTLHTSGTTARPKRVVLTHGMLAEITRGYAELFALVPADRGLEIMPLVHTHGIFAYTASLWAGSAVAVAPRVDPDTVFALMRAFKPTWYTAVPTVHQALLAASSRYAEVVAAQRLRFVRSSAANLGTVTARKLRDVFDAGIIETYGLTECSLVTASFDGARREGSVGRAVLHNVEICTLANGELAIRGPAVVRAYENDPQETAHGFSEDGWFRTGDLGRVDDDGFVYLTGRIKEIINKGGENIAPVEIDEALLAHADIVEAVTFAMPHPTLGETIAAAVVLRAEAALDESTLVAFASERLADYKVPQRILIVENIPKGPTGKYQRNRLADLLGAGRSSGGARRSPRTVLERAIADAFASVLGLDEVGLDDDFFALGGNSLEAARLAAAIETATGRRLELKTLLVHRCVENLATALAGSSAEPGADVARDVLEFNRAGSGLPFVFLHQDLVHDGAYCFGLAGALGSDHPVFALAPHGLAGESVPETVEAMAEDVVARIGELIPHGAFAIGGFCAGGTVALEAARRLRERGRPAACVVMVNSVAKNANFLWLDRLVRALGAPEKSSRRFVRARSLVTRAGLAIRQPGRAVRFFTKALRRRMHSADESTAHGPVPSLETWERHVLATTAYVPKRYDGGVTLIVAGGDKRRDRNLGWKRFLPHLRIVVLPETQNELVTSGVQRLATSVRACFQVP